MQGTLHSFSREHSTLSRHIERHHKDQMKNDEASVVCAKQEKTILTAKKLQPEQEIAARTHRKSRLSQKYMPILMCLQLHGRIKCVI